MDKTEGKPRPKVPQATRFVKAPHASIRARSAYRLRVDQRPAADREGRPTVHRCCAPRRSVASSPC